MSLEMCVLGSGSAGNSSLLRIDGRAMLIDAGFGPRAILKRLAGTGVTLADLRAILLTHLDRDHFQPTWWRAVLKHRIPIHCAKPHEHALYRRIAEAGGDARLLRREGLIETFDGQPFGLMLDEHVLAVRPIRLAHDRTGTFGYVLKHGGHRLGYATDLGHTPEHLIDALADVDVLAIESNYDRRMEEASDRPWRLKQRVMGGAGHLSNDEALAAVRRVVQRSSRPLRHLVLLHLSRQCNDPDVVRALYHADPALAGALRLTHQYQRTDWLTLQPRQPLAGEQLAMFG